MPRRSTKSAMRLSAILAGACVFGMGGLALANPILLVNEAYVQQFPGTNHVQVTLVTSYPEASTQETMGFWRDEQLVDADVEYSPGPTRDLGSGPTTLSVLVACDCNVPVGHHSYTVADIDVGIDVVDASAANGTVPEPSAHCDVVCAADVPVSPGTGGSAGDGSGGAAPTGGAGSGAAGGGASDSSGGAAPTGGAGSGAAGGGASDSSGGATPTGEAGSGVAGGGASDSSGGAAPRGGAGSGAADVPVSPATGGGAGGASEGAAAGDGLAPMAQAPDEGSDSSGCAVSRCDGRLVPLGILAALGLLAWRRKKRA
jgi:hypothetical protein